MNCEDCAKLKKRVGEMDAALKLCKDGRESLKRTVSELNDDLGEVGAALKAERELGDALAERLQDLHIHSGGEQCPLTALCKTVMVLARHAEARRGK